MALRGVRVVELAGLAPAPFCGMVLSDFGAKVIRVDKFKPFFLPDDLSRGKQSIAIDVKAAPGKAVMKKLCNNADVLVEPFRAGVMEKLGLGPSVLLAENPRLVYARLTGYGQHGAMSQRAGHDINYIATAGVLSRLGRAGDRPQPPVNLLADFAGGGLSCALGIVMALYERATSGKGQVIDANMVEGANYVSSFLYNSRDVGIWGEEKGTGWLDGGAPFYNTYETSDGGYMAVGAIEPQFYTLLLQGLGLDFDEAPQFGDFEAVREKFTKVFKSKTRDEWTKIFENTDACCTPVLSMDEAADHPHNVERKAFLKKEGAHPEPKPAPNLSRTPGVDRLEQRPVIGQHTREVLAELGYTNEEMDSLIKDGAVMQANMSKL